MMIAHFHQNFKGHFAQNSGKRKRRYLFVIFTKFRLTFLYKVTKFCICSPIKRTVRYFAVDIGNAEEYNFYKVSTFKKQK